MVRGRNTERGVAVNRRSFVSLPAVLLAAPCVVAQSESDSGPVAPPRSGTFRYVLDDGIDRGNTVSIPAKHAMSSVWRETAMLVLLKQYAERDARVLFT
jgi:hypothetical protein